MPPDFAGPGLEPTTAPPFGPYVFSPFLPAGSLACPGIVVIDQLVDRHLPNFLTSGLELARHLLRRSLFGSLAEPAIRLHEAPSLCQLLWTCSPSRDAARSQEALPFCSSTAL